METDLLMRNDNALRTGKPRPSLTVVSERWQNHFDCSEEDSGLNGVIQPLAQGVKLLNFSKSSRPLQGRATTRPVGLG